MRPTSFALLFILSTIPATAFGQKPSEGRAAAATPLPDPCATMLSSERIRTAVAVLDGMLGDPAPAGITPAGAREYQLHTEWLASVRERLRVHLADRDAALSTPTAPSDASRRMAAMDAQFLALQEAVLSESRRFQTLSNASKARHDVAMNAIRNMKA